MSTGGARTAGLDDRVDIAAARQGALSLLRDCIGVRPGERLLIVTEPEELGFYDHEAPRLTAEVARSLDLYVYESQCPATLDSNERYASVLRGLSGFDHVVFYSRIGDQVRFANLTALPPMTMCYTLDATALASPFATACHSGLCEVKNAIDTFLYAAEHIRVQCPRGTDYSGRVAAVPSTPRQEVTLKRFPMLVAAPLPCAQFAGTIVLTHFLTGTGSHYYDPYTLILDDEIRVSSVGNRIERFEGESTIVQRVLDHYATVSARFELDPWFVHSFHAGIHPGCRFSGRAEHDLLRWSGSAFGNPRLLHFHTCGNYAPGEICWNIVDPTITVDDVVLWEEGCLHPERLPGSDALIERHPKLFALYATSAREIGLSG